MTSVVTSAMTYAGRRTDVRRKYDDISNNVGSDVSNDVGQSAEDRTEVRRKPDENLTKSDGKKKQEPADDVAAHAKFVAMAALSGLRERQETT